MIETSFIVALSVLFIHATTWEGMIFRSVYEQLKHLPDWIKKPLYDCPICMAPWWGALMMLTFHLVTGVWRKILGWLLILFAAGGINTVLIYIVSYAKNND